MFSGSGSYFFRAVSWTHLKLSNTNDATHLSTGLNLATKHVQKKNDIYIYMYIYCIYIFIYIYIAIYIYKYIRITNCTQLPQNSYLRKSSTRPAALFTPCLSSWSVGPEPKQPDQYRLCHDCFKKDPEIIAYSSGPPQTLVAVEKHIVSG